MVAVETRIAIRPPPRTGPGQKATRRAPPSGFSVEAAAGQRMECLDWRKERIDDADEALPGEVGLLAASPKRLEPEPAHHMLGWLPETA